MVEITRLPQEDHTDKDLGPHRRAVLPGEVFLHNFYLTRNLPREPVIPAFQEGKLFVCTAVKFSLSRNWQSYACSDMLSCFSFPGKNFNFQRTLEQVTLVKNGLDTGERTYQENLTRKNYLSVRAFPGYFGRDDDQN